MRHRWADVVNDCVAGFVVGVLAIPKGLSLAAMAGLPPVNGLYASLFGNLPYFFLGTSPVLVVGPTAVLSLMTRGAVPKHIEEGSPEWISFAATLAFFSGLVQLGMGMGGFGVLIQLISEPVMQGFITASAVLIILSQVPQLVGTRKCDASLTHGAGHEYDECFLVEYMVSAYKLSGEVHSHTALFSSISILVLVLFPILVRQCLPSSWQRVGKFGSVALLVGSLGVFAYTAHTFGLEERGKALIDIKTGVSLLGEIPTGLPLPPTSPFAQFAFGDFKRMFGAAVMMAVVGFMESSAIAAALKRTTSPTTDTDQPRTKLVPKMELVALGACNLVCSATKGYPVCASFGRTAVNAECGAKIHQLSPLVSSLVVLLVLVVCSKQVKYVPNFVLAVIVAQSVLGLIVPSRMLYLYRTNMVDFVTFTVTAVVTATLGFEVGLCSGVLANWSASLLRLSPLRVELLSANGGSSFVDGANQVASDVAVIRMQSALNFRTAPVLEQVFEDVCDLFGPRCVIVDLAKSDTVDVTGVDALNVLAEQCQFPDAHSRLCSRGALVIVGLHGDARRVVERAVASTSSSHGGGDDELTWNLMPRVGGEGGSGVGEALISFASERDALAYCRQKLLEHEEEARSAAAVVVLSSAACALVDEARAARWRQGGSVADEVPGCRLPSFARQHAFELVVNPEAA